MKNKKIALLGALIIIIIAAFSVLSGSGLLKGSLSEFRPKPTLVKHASVTNLDILKNKLTALKPSLQGKAALSTKLSAYESKIAAYRQKIESSSDEEKELLVHKLDHEELKDKVLFVKKTATQPQTLDRIDSQVAAINTLIAKNKITNVPKELQQALQIISKDGAYVRTLYSKGLYDDAQIAVEKMKADTLPKLYAFKKNARRTQLPQNFINALLGAAENVRREIVFSLPSPNLPFDRDGLNAAIARRPQQPQQNNGERVAICITRWEPNIQTLSEEELRSIMSEVDAYYREISFGKARINLTQIVDSGQIWANNLPGGDPDELSNFGEIQGAVDMCDPFIDFTQIDGLIVYPSMQALGGLGRTQEIISEEGVSRIGVAQIGNYNPITNIAADRFNKYLVSHELGHALFSQGHANAAECGDVTINAVIDQCQLLEYGNRFDMMGSGNGHIGGWGKYIAGKWIRISTLLHDGDINLHNLETATNIFQNLPQLIRVPLDPYPVCIEYRRPIGEDAIYSEEIYALQDPPFNSGGIPAQGGLVIEYCPVSGNHALSRYLLDPSPHQVPAIKEEIALHPESNSIVDFANIFIPAGEAFASDELGITLSWDSFNSTTARVHININEAKIATHYDLLVQSGYGGLLSGFGGNNEVSVYNNSEIPIPGGFTILVSGFRQRGVGLPVTIREYRVDGLEAGESRIINTQNIAGYEEINITIDSGNEIAELDELNNTWIELASDINSPDVSPR
ncbi:hypothetical protein KBD59_05120 [Candidatus Gracilibacteria bacterium]|nr:hypothetical protein [Candidatus Gracilibacteria bacterium]